MSRTGKLREPIRGGARTFLGAAVVDQTRLVLCRVVDRSSYNANRSLVVSGMPILVIARRQSR
jgi:hypothetical protein